MTGVDSAVYNTVGAGGLRKSYRTGEASPSPG